MSPRKNKTAELWSSLAARGWRRLSAHMDGSMAVGAPTRTSVGALMLHMRPLRVPASALRYTHTFGLGGMSLVLFMLLLGTGLLMIFVYEASPTRAYQSILGMQEEILFGRLIRAVHYWSANLMLGTVLLHMLRVFLTGAFHGARRSNWFLGLALLLLVLLSGFTGYLLPWDQTSYWAITICTEMLGYVPGVGQYLQRLILGGVEIGPATLINFFALHAIVVPLMLLMLMTWHFWCVRISGGVVVPRSDPDSILFVPFHPDLYVRETAVALILIASVLLIAIAFGAPLGEPANPGMSPNPAKAPWYFMGFQELLFHFHPVFAIFVFPAAAAIGLIAVAYMRPESGLSGNWFLSPKGRHMAALAAGTAVVLTPLWVLADEFVAGPAGWLPGTAPWISNGLFPCAALAAGLAAFYVAVKKLFSASRDETVQALFVLLVVGFSVLTVIGVWFRGTGMALMWPWTT